MSTRASYDVKNNIASIPKRNNNNVSAWKFNIHIVQASARTAFHVGLACHTDALDKPRSNFLARVYMYAYTTFYFRRGLIAQVNLSLSIMDRERTRRAVIPR